MSLTTEPSGQITWATSTINNSPTGGPNKEAYDSRFATGGWTYGEHPPYQVFNEWQYNMYTYIDWAKTNLQRHEDAIELLGGGGYSADITVSTGSFNLPKATHGVTDPTVTVRDAGGTVVTVETNVNVSDDVSLILANGDYKLIIK